MRVRRRHPKSWKRQENRRSWDQQSVSTEEEESQYDGDFFQGNRQKTLPRSHFSTSESRSYNVNRRRSGSTMSRSSHLGENDLNVGINLRLSVGSFLSGNPSEGDERLFHERRLYGHPYTCHAASPSMAGKRSCTCDSSKSPDVSTF